MIRVATQDDIPALVLLGEAMHTESPRYSRLRYNGEKVAALLGKIIGSDTHLVLVADECGIVGVAIAFIDVEWFSDDYIAQELVVFVKPARRGSSIAPRLIIGLDTWAQAKGVPYMQAGVSTGVEPERTACLYEKLSFTRVAIGLERHYN